MIRVSVDHLYFDAVADVQAAMKPRGKELFADVQISEMIHS